MTTDHDRSPPLPRRSWPDRWLLDAFRETVDPVALEDGDAESGWEALEAAGVETDDILLLISDLFGFHPVDVSGVGPDEQELLPQGLSLRFDVVPVHLEGNRLRVATANPLGHNFERDLAFACGHRVTVATAHPADVRAARARIYGGTAPVRQDARIAWGDIRPGVAVRSDHVPRGRSAELLEGIVLDAVDQRASDIHLEPAGSELRVRYRVDGILHDVRRIPADLAPLLLSRLKVAAGLDIADRLRPQDGRAQTQIDGRQVDLRISTLPLGERVEKAVIRILDTSATSLTFEELGFNPGEQEVLNHVLRSKEGMVLVTGPTGSGKTTTLYAALRSVMTRQSNVVTVEDPIEYRLDGLNQVQVHEKSGLTFAAALRSILRQDPDVVLVGEIRDAETATIAIRASMTGHMVLSTLHTNDAPSAVGRLADIGVDMSSLAGALKAVVAQRLVRKLCPECCAPAVLDDLPIELHWVFEGRNLSGLRQAVGCAACRGTGFRGRMAIAEMLVIDDETQELMARSKDRHQILQLARRNGMNTLWETGVERVLQGRTSLQELLSILTPPLPDSAMEQEDVDLLFKEVLGSGDMGEVALVEDVEPEPEPHPVAAVATPAPDGGTRRIEVAPRHNGARLPRVLVAHDDRKERGAIRNALEREGLGVIEVADGEAALAYAARLRPDLLVTPCALPRLDGLGLLQMLASAGVPEPVVIFTHQNDRYLHAWARELGAADVVPARLGAQALARRVAVLLQEIRAPRGAAPALLAAGGSRR